MSNEQKTQQHTPGPKLCGRCGEPQPETQDWFGEAVRMKAINADLLAALKELASMPNKHRPDRVCAEARAAIAKAEG